MTVFTVKDEDLIIVLFIVFQNGEVAFKNGSVKISPEVDAVTGEVSIEYETREATAKAGKDFRYKKDLLVSISKARTDSRTAG